MRPRQKQQLKESIALRLTRAELELLESWTKRLKRSEPAATRSDVIRDALLYACHAVAHDIWLDTAEDNKMLKPWRDRLRALEDERTDAEARAEAEDSQDVGF